MVVRGPHLDHSVEVALLEAAQQVAEVRREIGRLAVGPNDDAVLLFIVRLAEPEGAVSVLDVSRLAQSFDRRLCKARLPQPVLVVPLVVADVDARDGGLNAIHHPFDRVHPELWLGLIRRKLFDVRQVVARHLRELFHVVARVAAFGRLEAVQSREDREPKPARLQVVGVDVVLALHVVPGELEETTDRVAEGYAASVTDVQRSGRVDAAELDLQALAAAHVARAVTAGGRRDLAHEAAKPVLGEAEVDVAAVGLDRGGPVWD